MDTNTFTIGRAVSLGAKRGSIAFFAAGVLEIWLIAILPWFLVVRENYRPFDVFWSAVFIAAYAVVGAIVGAICAACLFWFSARFRNADAETPSMLLWAALSLILLLTLESNNFFDAGQYTSTTRLVISKVLIAIWVVGVLLSVRLPALRFLVYPAVAVTLYMGSICVFDTLLMEGFGRRGRYAGLLVAVILTFAAGYLAQRFRYRLPPGLATLMVLAVTGLGISAVLKPAVVRHAALSSTPASGKPNVILIVMDTVRASHLSAYGYSRRTSPNLEQFASHATRFTNMLAAGDWTLPSHASMFTGMYVRRHGAHNAPDYQALPLSRDSVTLAELLSKHGFTTAAVVSNVAVVAKSSHLDQGFEHFDQSWNPWTIGWYSTWSYSFRATVSRLRFVLPSYLYADCRPANLINAAAEDLVDGFRAKNQPFFLFLNYMEAHDPYISSTAFERRYGARGSLFMPMQFHDMQDQILRSERPVPVDEMKGLAARYDAGITSLDEELGKFFAWLQKSGAYDNSLIIVTSDHGEAFGEHGAMEHGAISLYQELVHVPLMVKYPNNREPRVVSSPVSHVDLAPTVLEVLGYPVPDQMDGISLRLLDAAKPRTVFSELYPQAWAAHPRTKRFRYPRQAALEGNRKLISTADGTRELYDLSADPGEDHNLIAQESSQGANLETKLTAWRKSATPAASGQPAKMSPAALERLKSLGYVQGK